MNDLPQTQEPMPVDPSLVAPPVAPPRPASRRRVAPALFVGAGLLLALLCFGVATSMVYLRPPTDGFVRAAAKALPYPAAYVNGEAILLRDYLAERDAIDRYAQSGGLPGTDSAAMADSILDTLINKAALFQMAADWGLAIDEARVETLLADVRGADAAAFEAELSSNFGWDTDEFRDRVLRSVVLANQLNEFVAQDADLQSEAHGRAQAAQARLDAGEDFAAVAGDMSDDASAYNGGDVGLVSVDGLAGSPYEPVLDLASGERSGIISTPDAFLLVRLAERVAAPDGEQLKLSVIVVAKKSLEEFVDEYLQGSKVRRLLTRA